jgi:2,3-bisphosphoglycerate-independent phosphoglycerate mutase
MIGHTGDMKAAITTVAEIDRVVKQLVETTLAENGAIVVTADHGNIDEMINARGEVSTAHSLSRVPFILVSEKFKDVKLQEGGKLANIAPTILKVLDIEKSPKMTDPLF